MDKGLREWLESMGGEPIEPVFIEDLHREMETAVPEIVEAIRQREQLAHELRHSSILLF